MSLARARLSLLLQNRVSVASRATWLAKTGVAAIDSNIVDAVMVQRHVSAQRRQVYVLHINIATAVSRELAKIGLVRFSFQEVSAGTDSTGSNTDIVFS
jgi:hypothetical protein